MNNIFIVLVLLSLVALSNANFVYDKRLLNKKQIGRDFSGSVRYGSFLYSGSCPPTTSGLTGISIALADSTGSSCFTDASTGAVSTTIGYICTPGTNGGPATIEFGFPGNDGFVIGGANFAGAGVADPLGFKWGSVGQPTYTGGSATASCSSTCTSTYCGGHCTATCSDTKTSTGESCADSNSGGTYYFVPTAVNPTNCGSLGSCCNTFTYPSLKKVLIVHASPYVSDVQNKLQATGAFSGSVDVFNANTGTPSLALLQNYDSVFVFSDGGFSDSVTLGNNLASFIDLGGGVVSAAFETASVPLGGNFDTNTYRVMIPSGQTQGTTQTLGVVDLPAHPLMAGISSFNGGTSSYRSTSTSLTPGSYHVAHWNDGRFLIAAKDTAGAAGDKKRVDLGFYPPSSDIRSDFWVSSTDGVKIMVNALIYAGNTFHGKRYVPLFRTESEVNGPFASDLRN